MHINIYKLILTLDESIEELVAFNSSCQMMDHLKFISEEVKMIRLNNSSNAMTANIMCSYSF